MTEIIIPLLTFAAGLVGGYTLKIVVDARRNTTTVTSDQSDRQRVTQRGNLVGGDMAGRDVNKGPSE